MHLQIDSLDPPSHPFGVHHRSRVHLLHHVVLGQKSHRLPHLRPPAPADSSLKGQNQA